MKDVACLCGHGSTQHVENTLLPFGYRCTECACMLLQSRPGDPFVEVPDPEDGDE